MPLANISHKWGALLVRPHGETRPHVMLDLVVEVSMEKVNKISTHLVVNAGKNLTEVEGPRECAAAFPESVHVISCMIRNNCNETMDIG